MSQLDLTQAPDPMARSMPPRDEIARLAYQFYLMRGRQNGRDLEDWLSAERELLEHYRWLETD
jgi:Protein of unknown function (DUF2934)